MRVLLIPLVLLLAGTAPAAANPLFSCDGNQSNCLTACTRSGISREDCVQMLRRMQRAPQPSVAVQPNTRSKYKPVPQGSGGSQQPGPYVNEQ
jgi:hypothetical protein